MRQGKRPVPLAAPLPPYTSTIQWIPIPSRSDLMDPVRTPSHELTKRIEDIKAKLKGLEDVLAERQEKEHERRKKV
jgi:hypothetical protein